MPFDFSASRVAPGEKPASSTKQNNMIQSFQDAVNAMPPANLVGYPADGAKFLNGAGGWSTPVTDMKAVYVKTTPFELVNNGTMLDLFQNSIFIPAGMLGPSAAIKIWCGGEYYNNDGSTAHKLRIVLSLGPATVWDSGMSDNISVNGVSTDRRGWHFSAVIQALGSTSSQRASGLFSMNTPSAAAAGAGKLNNAIGLIGPFEGAQTGVNMAGQQALLFQAQHDAPRSTVSITLQYARVEVSA